MKRWISFFAAVLCVCLLLTGCGVRTAKTHGGSTADIAGDYYIDLTDLGMKLTIYLRVGADGTFRFSSATDFSVNKSDGTIENAGDEYLMVYTSVNGEEKSISDGLNSKFLVQADGSLDFTVCERIYYGTATATTTSADNPDAKLIAYPLPSDYTAPSGESDFTPGAYTGTLADTAYTLTFFDDNSYLLLWTSEDVCKSETGRYGVSTTQLALTPQGGNRVSCDVMGEAEISVRVPGTGEEREVITMRLSEAQTPWKTLRNADTEMRLYTDGSYSVTANGFAETGILAPDSEAGTFKIYPDHPDTGARGLLQVSSVPTGTFQITNGKWSLSDLRVRTSASLSREKVTVTEA